MKETPEHREILEEVAELIGIPVMSFFGVKGLRVGSVHEDPQGLQPVNYMSGLQLTTKAQELILRYQSLHGDVSSMPGVVNHYMAHHHKPLDHSPDFSTLFARAFLIETPLTAMIFQSLVSDLTDNDKRSASLSFGEMNDLLVTSTLYYQPPFPATELSEKNLAAYHAIIRPSTKQSINMFMARVLKGDLCAEEIKNLLKKLDDCDLDKRVGWSDKVVNGFIYVVHNFEARKIQPYREALLGSDRLTSSECSTRVKNSWHSIYGSASTKGLADNLAEEGRLISLNGIYADKILINDLICNMKEEIQSDENIPSDDFSTGESLSKNLAIYLISLGLRDYEVSILSLHLINDFSLGEAYDSSEDPTCGAMSLVQKLFKERKWFQEKRKNSLVTAICVGLLECFSESTKKRMLESDQGKIVWHGMTGDKSYLNGLRNKSLIDQVFAQDLGL